MAEQTPHDDDMAISQQDHVHRVAEVAQRHEHLASRRQQIARLLLIFLIVVVWLGQTGYVTLNAVKDPNILADIEKFIALIGVTGAVAGVLVMKLWPQSKDD